MPSGELVFIEGENNARFPDANCLFIDDEVRVVVDPATRPDRLVRIERDRPVDLVINTHYHIDHIRYNKLFPGASVAAHRLDAPPIESLDDNARWVGIENEPWLPIWKSVMRDTWGYSEREVTIEVEDGREMSLGENVVRFVHLPGHTPGHTCLHFPERRAFYLADIDLTGFGPWYGNRRSDIDEFLESLERVKTIDADTWYTGHEEGVIEGDITDRVDAFARVVAARDERILEFISGGGTLPEMIEKAIIYGKRWEPAVMFDYFEGLMLSKHLERLERRGLARREGERWLAS